jgi:hypothetical protein
MFSTEGGWLGLVTSLNGTVIPMSLYSVGPIINFGPVETFIGDIQPFAGQQNVELRFTGSGVLDAIQFVAPEPSTLLLLCVGAGSLCSYVCRHRRTNPRQQS